MGNKDSTQLTLYINTNDYNSILNSTLYNMIQNQTYYNKIVTITKNNYTVVSIKGTSYNFSEVIGDGCILNNIHYMIETHCYLGDKQLNIKCVHNDDDGATKCHKYFVEQLITYGCLKDGICSCPQNAWKMVNTLNNKKQLL
ncbi:MAG: hypothetical protein Edafosvirus1_8 [Edafosvirus sp.]|uniref:Uncharacterized protein n=1 Tax=Edafosvirus sp. TaxID=2487765 RepID=A0A3G4ZRZ6_9VIRU|nr:MAG: hypothetical protein Edafosvirus1_8 [Edafosvirus sp.]